MTTTTNYAMVFSFHDIVEGNGFVAKVIARGRLFTAHEDDEWTMYGVQPGSIVECGATFEEARLLFRQTYRDLLTDIAEESHDFDAFKINAEAALNAVNKPFELAWMGAAAQLRADRSAVEDALKNLPVVSALDTPIVFEIQNLIPAMATVQARVVEEFELADAA